MESLLVGVNWTAVVVSAVAAFMLGWLWYSETLFGLKWREGIGISPDDTTSMKPAMITQLLGTFLLAWVIGITAAMEDLYLAGLVALTIALLIEANGFFSQKSRYAIAVEAGFVLAMVVVMILVHAVL